MPLSSVATLSPSDLQMKGVYIWKEGKSRRKGKKLHPHKQSSLSIFKHLLELDDPARSYSILRAWQHTMVTLKQKVLILSYEKGKIPDQPQKKSLTCS